MIMFTVVQVIGNVFSSYKYIINNSVEDLRYFKEPIFIWTSLPDQEATVIVTWAIGALLPIASLLLTSMITNYLSDEAEKKLTVNKENEREQQDIKTEEETPDRDKESEQTDSSGTPEETKETKEEYREPVKPDEEIPDKEITEENKPKSHFINLT